MLIIKHTVTTSATPAQIWQVLQDVENWNTWDHGIEFSRLDGPFQNGSKGSFKPKDGPEIKTVLTSVEPFKAFVQEAQLFCATVVMKHTLSQDKDFTHVTFQTEIKGPLAFFYACFIGRSIKKKVPVEMEELLKKVNLLERK